MMSVLLKSKAAEPAAAQLLTFTSPSPSFWAVLSTLDLSRMPPFAVAMSLFKIRNLGRCNDLTDCTHGPVLIYEVLRETEEMALEEEEKNVNEGVRNLVDGMAPKDVCTTSL